MRYSKPNTFSEKEKVKKVRIPKKCPLCGYNKIITKKFSDYGESIPYCTNCRRIFSFEAKTKEEKVKSTETKDKNSLIQKAYNEHRSIIMTYKGLSREVYPYTYNDTYIVAYCTYANELRTFRIDRIKSAKLGDVFKVKKELSTEAEKQINNAKYYRYHKYS